MLIARQSTAKIVTVGPVLDADGVAVTGGVVGDFKLSKNGGAPAALNGSATLTHRHTGFYSLSLTTSDLDTVGSAEVTIDDTVNSCPLKEIIVVEEAVYDAFYAASAVGYVANQPVTLATDSITSAALSAGAVAEMMQAISKVQYGCKGTVWHVSEGGNDSNDGLTWATPLLTLTQAITNHAANDTIVLRGAITNNSAAGQVLTGVSIFGLPGTTVTSSFATANAAWLKPGSKSTIRGFKLNFTDTSGTVFFPIGLNTANSDTAKVDVTIEDMDIVAPSDGIYANPNTCTNWVIRRNRIITTYDAISCYSGAGSTWLIEDNDMTCTGPFPAGGNQDANGCTVYGGTFVIRRNRFKISGGELANYGIQDGNVGVKYVYDNVFDVSGTAAADIIQQVGTVYDCGNNRGTGTGGALSTSGTITNRKGHYQPDWTTINAATTTQNLSGTTIKNTTDVAARLPAALTGDGLMKSDALAIDGVLADADALGRVASNLDRAAKCVTHGTCDSGATTTTIPTKSLSPAAVVADQFQGEIMGFPEDTATAALRGQKTRIEGNTDTGVFTVLELTTAPAEDDVFVIE